MFDWFKKKPSNVVPFPGTEKAEATPAPAPPPKEEPAKIYYRFGLTDNNRVSFQMGYSEITMNRQGCENLIHQLTFFMNQLSQEEDD